MATNVAIVDPFRGRLDNSGEIVELLRPGTPLASGDDCPGFVTSILVDRVAYAASGLWLAGSGWDRRFASASRAGTLWQ